MKKIILVCLTSALLVGALIACTPVGAPDTTPPTVSAVSPTGTGVALNVKISATFDEAMDATTIVAANFTISPSVPGTVTYDAPSMTATFSPTANLAAGTAYTATVSTGVKDSAGNALAANKVWSFTTGAAADNTPPTVLSTVPISGATGVPTSSVISVTFSEPMLASTMIGANIQVVPSVSGTANYDAPSKTLTLTPSPILASGTSYSVTVTTGVKDSAGNAMAANKVWTFTTTAAGPGAVVLGGAGNYVILAETGITTTGVTSITGDIAASPSLANSITGFGLVMDSSTTFSTSSLVTGKVYAADYTEPTPSNLTAATTDMMTAYTNANGMPHGVGATNLNLGGGIIATATTLAPGTYTWTTDLDISANVILSGGANDTWLFQVAQNLTVENGIHVTVSGGAQAKNITWVVSGGAGVTLGTTTQFQGIILAATQITMNSGASLVGRALSQTAVPLTAATIMHP